MVLRVRRVSKCYTLTFSILDGKLIICTVEKTRSEKRQRNRLSQLLFRKKSKRTRGDKPAEPTEEVAQEPTSTQEAPIAATTGAAAAAVEAAAEPAAEPAAESATVPAARDEVEPKAEDKSEHSVAAPENVAVSKMSTAEDTHPEPAAAQDDAVFAASPAAPIAAPVRLVTTGPSDTAETHPQRDAAATGVISDMHIVRPITSPRADSKLKTWFRDRLVRRSSGPVPVYPHQPGPDFQTDSEIGFTGGAALTGRDESRGAALSSHPVSANDLDQSPPHNGTFLDVTKTSTHDSESSPRQNGGKRERLRKSFMKTLSRNSNSQEPKTNGFANGGHSRQSSNALSETKATGESLQGLRDSATEHNLPVPPILGQTASTGRESRFSEDL